MSSLSKQTLDTAKIVVLAAILVLGVNYVYAGPPAGSVPPSCPAGSPGCDVPVNVGSVEQEKTGLLNVGGLVSRYGVTVQGNIIAAAGTFSGAITGGSLNVGAGAVTAGQGTFSNGLTVGTPDGTFEYLQLDNKTSFGSPTLTDCDAQAEGGRMYYDSSIGLLYLCVQGRSTATENGWKPVSIEYVTTQ